MDRKVDYVWRLKRSNVEYLARLIVDFNMNRQFDEMKQIRLLYLASSTRAKTPAASGAAADVPECFKVH